MPLVNFSNLDFDQIKTSIKDYIRANSNFTDYDFEGSNLSTIIDTLAYNTYITSYNANMVTNEVFIDSATLRENVVSLARNIGYIPRSKRAARLSASFTVSGLSNVASATLKKGLVAITSQRFGNQDFVFSIPNDITVPVNAKGVAEFFDIVLYEGTFVTQSFTVNSRNPDQKFILPNTGIDTTTIDVTVNESATSTLKNTYKQYNSLIDVGPETRIYFLQEIGSEQYELLFGDGIIAKKLEEPNQIDVGYIVSSGSAGNNVQNIAFAGSIVTNSGQSVTSGYSAMFVDGPSIGGAEIESIDSIKKYGPQVYASQNRAVTSADYEALIPRIYPEAESVSAYGGEDLNPPQYGKVFVSIKPINGVFLSNCLKDNLASELAKYKVAGVKIDIIDLSYLFIETDSAVYFNSNLTPTTLGGDDGSGMVSNPVRDDALRAIDRYANSTELNKFGGRFKYSKFQAIVDRSNAAVTSNITNLQIRRDLEPKLNQFAEYELCYGNRFKLKNHCRTIAEGVMSGFNIKTSGFKISGVADTVYIGDLPSANMETGELFLFKLNAPRTPVIVKRNIGVIDYKKGEIMLNPIKIVSTQIVKGTTPVVEISAIPYSNDVIGLQDLYLQLDLNYAVVNTIIDQIDSKTDVSGSNYIVSPSFDGNSLVRGTPILVGTQVAQTTLAPIASPSTVVTETTPVASTQTQSVQTPTTSYSPPNTSSSSSGSSYGY
tara:strand:+ start:271 stop:2418 length:2148 start_codon:yes stop_codon:yes gene_type:complete